MSAQNQVMFQLMVYLLPFLMAILAFIGGLAVKALMKMGNDIGEIRITIAAICEKHDGLEARVDKMETKIYN